MIRLRRPATAPRILRTRGAEATAADLARFAAEPEAYRGGTKRFAFDSGIYGAKSVKNALKRMQHDKCAFCEARVTHVAHGDVEHLRPKGGVRQDADGPIELPGYFWLAYDWANLFFACQICNQTFKRNWFPLRDPTRRAHLPEDDLAGEEPMLLDAAIEDPEAHITFREELAIPREDSERGATTIRVLGLNRSEIQEQRLKLYQELALVRDLVDQPEVGQDLIARAVALLRDRSRDTGEYAAMARALLAARPLPEPG